MGAPEQDSRNVEVVKDALRVHWPELEAFVRARLAPQDAAEALQAAAMRAIERSHSLSDPNRARAWLFRVLRNVIVDGTRSRASQMRLVDADAELPAATEAVAGEDACGCSIALVNEIDSRYSTILRLVDLDERTVDEAAKVLKITPNNAAVRLHRARKALRKQMREHCGVESASECAYCRCVYDGCCPV